MQQSVDRQQRTESAEFLDQDALDIDRAQVSGLQKQVNGAKESIVRPRGGLSGHSIGPSTRGVGSTSSKCTGTEVLQLASNPEAVALAMKGITIGDTGGGLVR